MTAVQEVKENSDMTAAASTDWVSTCVVSEHCRLAKGGHVRTMNSLATCMSQKIRQYSTIYWKGITVPLTRMFLIYSIESCLLGDKIRNEHVIRPRAVILLSSEPACAASKKLCSRPTVAQKSNERLACSLGDDNSTWNRISLLKVFHFQLYWQWSILLYFWID